MKLKIREIVLVEECPFTFADFREFEIAGQKYHMKVNVHGQIKSKYPIFNPFQFVYYQNTK